jgi:putative molybdopterin biosynthesis protein
MGVLAAARAFDLDFVPVTSEPYDLVLELESLNHPVLAPFWELLSSPEFRSAVEELGGYHAAEMGRRIR